jgi:hypothetical protein
MSAGGANLFFFFFKSLVANEIFIPRLFISIQLTDPLYVCLLKICKRLTVVRSLRCGVCLNFTLILEIVESFSADKHAAGNDKSNPMSVYLFKKVLVIYSIIFVPRHASCSAVELKMRKMHGDI